MSDNKLYPISNYAAAERAYNTATRAIDAADHVVANIPHDIVDLGGEVNAGAAEHSSRGTVSPSVLEGDRFFPGAVGSRGGDGAEKGAASVSDSWEKAVADGYNPQGAAYADAYIKQMADAILESRRAFAVSNPSNPIASSAAAANEQPRARAVVGKSGFAGLLEGFAKNNIAKVRKAEESGQRSLAGEGSMLQLASDIAEADLALQQLVEVKNSFIDAWNKVLSSSL